MVPVQSTTTVLYSEWTGFPRGPNPSQSLLFGRQQVTQPKQPWLAYTTPRRPTIEAEQDTAQRHTQFYNVAARTTTVTQPWMAYTTPRKPTVEAEQDVAQRRSQFYNPPYQTVGQPWIALTTPRRPTIEAEQDTAQRHTWYYNPPYQTVGQPWIALTVPRKPVVEAEQDTAQRRTWFYNQQTTTVSGTVAIQGYTTNVLYEANTGFPRIPPPLQQLLFGRTTPTAPTPQPFYAYKWANPPTVTAEDYSTYRTPANFQLFVQPPVVNGTVGVLAYSANVLYEANTGFPRTPVDNSLLLFNRTTVTRTQPFYAYNWGKPPVVTAEEYTPRTPINFWSFVQPAPINGTLAYLAYQTNVFYEANTGFPRQSIDNSLLLFNRPSAVTPNVYPWTALGWTKPPTVQAEEYAVRTPYPASAFFWRTPTLAPTANNWYALHWQQAVSVEAEPYRVTSPFPFQSFYWKSPYVPPPYSGMTIWDATYQVVNDNMIVYPIEWIMSATVPWGYVISRTPYPDSAQPNWTYIKMVASAGPPASLGYTTVPDLTVLRGYDANTLLATIGLTLGTVTYANSSTVAAGFVISQSVTAGSSVPLGTIVSYVVSLGAVSTTVYTTVPTVTNLTLATATAAIVQANLMVVTPQYQSSNTVPAGSVISQTPLAGTTQSLWTPVSLVVSSGPAAVAVTAIVPNIVGQTAAVGTSLLTAVGLVAGMVTYSYQTSIAAGIIVSQAVTAGSVVTAGTTVAYVVSLGPQPVVTTVTVPNVVGLTLNAARSTLVNANLVVGSPVYAHSATVAADTVISQSPVAGMVVSLYTTINLTVSSG